MNDRVIHRKQGHGYDEKYSDWRRSRYPNIVKATNHYCADVDWVEWRKGKPVAVIECRRALYGKTLDDAVNSVYQLNNGFQIELLATVAKNLNVAGYIVAISDQNPEDRESYSKATFRVMQVVIPNPYPTKFGTLVPELVRNLKKIDDYDEIGFANFLSKL